MENKSLDEAAKKLNVQPVSSGKSLDDAASAVGVNPIVSAIADPEKGHAASKSLIDGIGDSLSKMSGFFESFMNPASKVLGSIAQAPGRALVSAGLDPAAGVVGAVKGKGVRAEYQPSGNIQKAYYLGVLIFLHLPFYRNYQTDHTKLKMDKF